MTADASAIARMRALADAFASHVEQGDLDAVRASLAADCTAAWFGVALTGDAIVRHAAAEFARLQREFDERRLEHRIEASDPDAATLHVTEYLMKMPSLWHRRHWEMTLRFDEAGRVTRVTLSESEDARGAYAHYRERCGFATGAA